MERINRAICDSLLQLNGITTFLSCLPRCTAQLSLFHMQTNRNDSGCVFFLGGGVWEGGEWRGIEPQSHVILLGYLKQTINPRCWRLRNICNLSSIAIPFLKLCKLYHFTVFTTCIKLVEFWKTSNYRWLYSIFYRWLRLCYIYLIFNFYKVSAIHTEKPTNCFNKLHLTFWQNSDDDEIHSVRQTSSVARMRN